jgi:hypothetical protein
MTPSIPIQPAAWVGALAAGTIMAFAGPAAANVALTRVSTDPFTNTTSQHATEVEPDTLSSGSTIVGAFQVGRFFNGGSTDIGFAQSTNGGNSYTSGSLPGLTATSGIGATTGVPYERVSDPSVAFDPAHGANGTWLISSIPLTSALGVPTVFISRSTDGGTTWNDPVSIPPPAANKISLDKNWTVCDTTSSTFRGHCYTEFDNFGQTDLEYMSTSTDGGLTWSQPVSPAGNPHGLGGQPLVQPDGTVIVPFETITGKEAAFESKDGGATWSSAKTIANIAFATVGGSLRTSPLPSAEIDGAGNVYVAWEDCRFRVKCSSNDIVFSSSSDGVHWSAVKRVPIDAVNSGADHFIPGLAVDKATSAAGAHLALTYYFYPDATCTGGCQLDVGYISSPDGGNDWGSALQLAGPMSLSNIANTSQGRMVGDYISTSFASGDATTLFAVGVPPSASAFDEAMYAPSSPLEVASLASAPNVARSTGVQSTGGTGTGALLQSTRRN